MALLAAVKDRGPGRGMDPSQALVLHGSKRSEAWEGGEGHSGLLMNYFAHVLRLDYLRIHTHTSFCCVDEQDLARFMEIEGDRSRSCQDNHHVKAIFDL